MFLQNLQKKYFSLWQIFSELRSEMPVGVSVKYLLLWSDFTEIGLGMQNLLIFLVRFQPPPPGYRCK